MVKLFKLLMSTCMQSLNIFGASEGFLFEFTSLSGVQKFEKLFNGLGPYVSDPFPFDRPRRSPGLVRRPFSPWPHSLRGERSVPVAAGHRRQRGLAPPYHCFGHHRGSRRPIHFFPSPIQPHSLQLCSMPAATLPIVASHRGATLSCPTRPKEVPRYRAPPAPRACPQHWLAKPAMEFLHHHLPP
jgi:hypothetical protein